MNAWEDGVCATAEKSIRRRGHRSEWPGHGYTEGFGIGGGADYTHPDLLVPWGIQVDPKTGCRSDPHVVFSIHHLRCQRQGCGYNFLGPQALETIVTTACGFTPCVSEYHQRYVGYLVNRCPHCGELFSSLVPLDTLWLLKRENRLFPRAM